MEIIKVENLSFKYEGEKDFILNNINLSINEGDFALIIGESGCGKSTLLRHLKKELLPFGERNGEVYYDKISIRSISQEKSSEEIGFVMQNPDNQIVTHKVWSELAFGLESLGYEKDVIRRRVAEISSFFGINEWFRKDIDELSGGQKQLLNLASILVMQPKVLILDEPTAQLDPIASKEFLNTLSKINNELGITIIIVEHRMEELFSICNRVILMDNGEIIKTHTPRGIGEFLYKNNHAMMSAMPSSMRIFYGCFGVGLAPLSIREGREFLRGIEFNKKILVEEKKEKHNPIIEIKNGWFRYERNSEDVMRGVDLKIYEGEIFSLLGGNGAGKTTTLGAISGNNTLYRGNVYIKNKKISKYKNNELYKNNLGVVPQDPQMLFVKNTSREELEEILMEDGITKEEINRKIDEVCELLDFKGKLAIHPYDLSGGEQQKLAMGKVMLLNPQIILLDEPTKGLDGNFKKRFGNILRELVKKGATIVMITHDIEFAAEFSTRCALFFDGDVVAQGNPREFFSGNRFYTTEVNRMSRGIVDSVITYDEVIKLWKSQE